MINIFLPRVRALHCSYSSSSYTFITFAAWGGEGPWERNRCSRKTAFRARRTSAALWESLPCTAQGLVGFALLCLRGKSCPRHCWHVTPAYHRGRLHWATSLVPRAHPAGSTETFMYSPGTPSSPPVAASNWRQKQCLPNNPVSQCLPYFQTSNQKYYSGFNFMKCKFH